MKTLPKFLLLSFLFLLALFACKKEQPEILNAEDPCECASEVSADFVIEEALNNIPHYDWVRTDTTLHSKEVQFSALIENAEYKWYIGIEEFDTKSISRYFSDQWKGHDIPITLVVQKEPNEICFPNDDGYDSITKTFHVSQFPILHGENQDIEFGTIEGYYRVFSNELNDSIDIGIDIVDRFNKRSVNVVNVEGNGINCGSSELRWIHGSSYRKVEFDLYYTDSSVCPGLSGSIHNKIDGEAELNFTVNRWVNNTSNFIETEYHYLGRKLSN